jgi:hypothetical protein
MPRASWLPTSFNAGEWSPLAQGRVDLAKYRNGLALCQNYVPLVQGGLTRRPGTRYVAEVKDSTQPVRLVRFEFSIAQAYVLEFGKGYIRFYTNDGQLLSAGVPYEVTTPYNAFDRSELWTLSFAQSADVLYIAHPSYPPMKLQRLGATNWTLTNIAFQDGPYLPFNTTTTTLTPDGTSGTVNVIASATTGINNDTGFQASDVGRMLRFKAGGVWLWGTITTLFSTTNIDVAIAPPIGSQTPTTAQATANISAGSVFSITVSNGGGGYGASPPSVTLSGGGGSGAVAYATVTNGVVTAITMSVTGTGYTSAPDVIIDPPTPIVPSTTTFWRLGLWGPGNYPACVVFNQDRLVWAGSSVDPSRVDGSNVSDYENMAPTEIDGSVIDSNAIGFSLNSSTVNAIRWMVSDEWGLLCGTAGGEWVVSPSNLQQAITPTNINAKRSTSYGVSATAAIRVGKSTLFVQRTGRKLREMTYQYVVNTFQAPDISLVSEHLTKSGILQITAALAPYQQLWMVRNDGVLIGVAYDKDQDCVGWHQHQLGGIGPAAGGAPWVESVATTPSPDTTRDELWVAVKRTINGVSKRYVEVMSKYWEDGDQAANAVFLDSSAAYTGGFTTTITGLTWLKGQTVGVLADGAVHPDCVVDIATSSITLNRPATVVQVGLKYSSKGKTLRIEAGGADGPAQGKLKRIHRVVFRFFQTMGHTLAAAVNGNPAISEPFRDSSMAMDQPVDLFSGDKRWSYEGTYDLEGQVSWEQDDPLPSNITMISAQLETQDGG